MKTSPHTRVLARLSTLGEVAAQVQVVLETDGTLAHNPRDRRCRGVYRLGQVVTRTQLGAVELCPNCSWEELGVRDTALAREAGRQGSETVVLEVGALTRSLADLGAFERDPSAQNALTLWDGIEDLEALIGTRLDAKRAKRASAEVLVNEPEVLVEHLVRTGLEEVRTGSTLLSNSGAASQEAWESLVRARIAEVLADTSWTLLHTTTAPSSGLVGAVFSAGVQLGEHAVTHLVPTAVLGFLDDDDCTVIEALEFEERPSDALLETLRVLFAPGYEASGTETLAKAASVAGELV